MSDRRLASPPPERSAPVAHLAPKPTDAEWAAASPAQREHWMQRWLEGEARIINRRMRSAGLHPLRDDFQKDIDDARLDHDDAADPVWPRQADSNR